jgi:hypothetical protein
MTDLNRQTPTVPLENAKAGLESLARRLALLHSCYAKAIINALGEKEGMRIISSAIKDFGIKIGEKTKEEVENAGLELNEYNFEKAKSFALPSFGFYDKVELTKVDGRPAVRVTGCLLAKIWKEYGDEKTGRLYCYMDVAKYMGYNPNLKCVHLKASLDGEDCCELTVKATTEEERERFFSEESDWFGLDK